MPKIRVKRILAASVVVFLVMLAGMSRDFRQAEKDRDAAINLLKTESLVVFTPGKAHWRRKDGGKASMLLRTLDRVERLDSRRTKLVFRSPVCGFKPVLSFTALPECAGIGGAGVQGLPCAAHGKP